MNGLMECNWLMIAIIGILAAIAIPQYQNYIARSQVARAVSETGVIKTAVEDCLNNGKTQAASDFGATGSKDVPVVSSWWGATAVITSTFGNSAATALSGNTVTWTRDANGTWICGTNVLKKYAQASCPTSSTN